MKAIVLNQPHGDLVLQDVAQPTPSTGQILVKIGAIGLNPVDWKQRAYNFAIPQYPAILGCDFSGTVEAIGPDVTKFIVGDAVYGFNPLGRTGFGTHAQYTLAYADIAVKKPPTLTSEQAAAISLPSLTAATGLFELLGLDVPHATVDTPARRQNLLVWGASSNVGAYAAQLAKLSGYSVTGVCSARNFEYVKSLGADHVVDYNSPSVVDDLKALGPFQYAYDVIGDASANLAAQVLVSGGHLVSPSISQGYKPPRDDVRGQTQANSHQAPGRPSKCCTGTRVVGTG
jgi:NADPH:quinone reductase-like Zn-dependent oxidoreductase